MNLKTRLQLLAHRLVIRLKAAMLHRQIESLYRRMKRMEQHQQRERELMEQQHASEAEALERRAKRFENAKHQLNAIRG